ncbi:MAG: NAD-dependent epimerase/dehydratase family protein [Elusimicrobia bacterium]|nr:NAD-dependent epimerase/dehydratase family protein [Elusimicrobiota bacterium]
MKKVLVTGGAGFVGSTIIKELFDQGIEPVALDLPHLEKRFAHQGKARFIGGDITDRESLRRVLDSSYDAVLHTAALFKYGAKRPALVKVNVEGTQALCEVMLEKGIKRLINWGSSTVYGFWQDPNLIKDETFPVNEEGLDENYAWSKRAQEKMGRSFQDKGLEVVTIRPGDIYGPGTPNGIALPLYFFKIGLMRAVPGFKEAFISHVHVDDVALAAIHLAQYPEASGQIYNIVDDVPLSNFETIRLVAKVFNTWMLPTKEKTLGIPIFHTHPAILKLSGFVEELRAKVQGGYPRFTTQSSTYVIQNHILSNKKLLATGFRLRWPDLREALPGVVDWYEKTNWAVLKG